MRFGRTDPGDCPICGAAHCSCGGGGPIEMRLLPNRDAAAVPVEGKPGLFGDGTDGRPFTTATYRGTKKKRSA